MKKCFSGLLATAIAFLMITLPIQSAEASPAKFKNCTELNKTHPGGVAKNAKIRNKGGKTKYKPTVSAELYNLHKGMDRDKDGIACER